MSGRAALIAARCSGDLGLPLKAAAIAALCSGDFGLPLPRVPTALPFVIEASW
jgi:hypothetical protein